MDKREFAHSGKQYLEVTQVDNTCRGCSLQVSCMDLPTPIACRTNESIAIETTPEAIAEYVALRLEV